MQKGVSYMANCEIRDEPGDLTAMFFDRTNIVYCPASQE